MQLLKYCFLIDNDVYLLSVIIVTLFGSIFVGSSVNSLMASTRIVPDEAIEHTVDGAVNISVHIRIFKSKRRIDQATITQQEIVHIAQALQAFGSYNSQT